MALPFALPPVVFPPPFDDGAAVRLATSLDQLADALRSMATREIDRAHGTVVDWRGFTRRWFDVEHRHVVQTLSDTANTANAEATAVRHAAAKAQAAAQVAFVAQQQYLAQQQAEAFLVAAAATAGP